ncbi:MAG TPA: hypothetical protein VFE51_09465 [Verrucomicrobiae bacterium]|nr:hypothetical protein [Verrucomicrobiae bacterium]
MRPSHIDFSCSRTCLLILTLSAAALCPQPTLTQPALYSYATIGGDEGVGSSDGTNKDIRFYTPTGIISDQAGNLFISDSGNFTIRKLTKFGTNWISSTLAGRSGFRGSADGTNSDATFAAPNGLALDSNGSLLVADPGSETIRKITQVGTNWVVSTIAGLPGAYGTMDGTNDGIRFEWPTRVAVNGAGEVFVADYLLLRKLVQEGTNWVSSTIDVPVDYVTSLSFDNNDRLYVAGTYLIGNEGNFGQVDLLTQLGTNWIVERLPIPPQGNYGAFTLAAGSGARVFVTKDNNTIWQSALIGTNWVWSQVAGQGGSNIFGIAGSTDGTNEAALFRGPEDIALDRAGDLFVADSGNHAIRKITPSGSDWVTTTIAGHPPSSASNDGTNQAAHFSSPYGVVVDADGSIYVADTGAHAIRETDRIGQDWVTHTIAGTLGTAGSADGTNTSANFNSPSSLALGGPGVLYVADSGNNTIRRLERVGTDWVTTTIIGVPGSPGSQDGTNGDIRLDNPGCIAAREEGELYVVEGSRLRRLTRLGTNWVSSTLVLSGATWVATSKNGEVFMADTFAAIYEVTSAGTNAVLNRIADYDTAEAMAVDSTGNLAAVDNDNRVVHKIARVGTNWVSYVIGGSYGYIGYEDGTNRDALFQGPSGIAVDQAGNLYVTDGNVLRLGMRTAVSAANPVIRDLQDAGEKLAFAWSTRAGLNYQIEYTSSLDQTAWTTLGSPILATNEVLSASDLTSQQERRFYRVVLLP